MPQGIIRDPKMNPEESDFGIVFIADLNSSEKGKHYKYSKDPDTGVSRFCIAGEDVEVTDPREFDLAEWIDGIKIYGEVTFVKRLAEEDQKGPVYKRLFPNLTLTTRKRAIREALENNEMTSPFQPPR